MPTALSTSLASVAWILAAMTALSALEALVPFRARGRAGRAHLVPNLALTGIAFAVSAALNVALVAALARVEALGGGLLRAAALGPLASGAAALVALDLSWYVAHVSMHKLPVLWRFHRVHHADPLVDVTTTVRQHPGESLVRYAFLAAFALPLGVSPAAFALYRLVSALHGLVEHANVRTPLALDARLSLLVTTPRTHKVHHSRRIEETDTNYANVFALFDRLFGTFSPSRCATAVAYGLDGFDDPGSQTTSALLLSPFRSAEASAAAAAAAR